ncbi:hypothetical protein KSP39_PZI009303 [Platanthera zijinensis]|uniref:Uncharacterized protein n=1 Tax=Platanthera zijinensis TaxID=2320716 RepID=A0AAP0BK19_9ASPA
MGYMSRVWMATSVAVVGIGHADQGAKWTAGLASMRLGKEGLAVAGVIPAALFASEQSRSGDFRREEGRGHAEDSVRKAMYLSCWGPS